MIYAKAQTRILVSVELYGIFENFNVGKKIVVECPAPITLKEFKTHFSKKLESASKKKCEPNLLSESAFATEKEIIHDEYVLRKNSGLSVLPPICGG